MKNIWRWLRIFKWSLIFAIVIIIGMLGSAPFFIYHKLNTEKPIANFYFTPVTQDLFKVTFYQGNMCQPDEFRVRGEQVQIDASFLKWQTWATMLGAESIYRFDRLSGRYRDIDMQIMNESTLVNLSPDIVFDPFMKFSLDASSNWLVASQFGSSVYADIDPSLNYIIYKTEDSLIIKSKSLIEFEDESLLIDIDPTCLKSPNAWAKLSGYINDIFITLLTS